MELRDTTLTEADIATLQGMENLRRLHFNNVTPETGDLSWVAPLKNLTEFTFDNFSGSVDLSLFSELTNLTRLSIFGDSTSCNAEDLSALSDLTHLQRLELSVPLLKSLDGLENMSELEELRLLVGTSLQNIDALAGLTSLSTLIVYNNGDYPYIRDLSPLYGLTQLKILDFSTYGVAD